LKSGKEVYGGEEAGKEGDSNSGKGESRLLDVGDSRTG
jgi:hypothetical protein